MSDKKFIPNLKLVNRWAKDRNLPKPELSERKNKKLKVFYNGNWIHFGHPDYSDFSLHRDKERQERYLIRARNIRDTEGKLTRNNKNSPNFWSIRLLWDG